MQIQTKIKQQKLVIMYAKIESAAQPARMSKQEHPVVAVFPCPLDRSVGVILPLAQTQEDPTQSRCTLDLVVGGHHLEPKIEIILTLILTL